MSPAAVLAGAATDGAGAEGAAGDGAPPLGCVGGGFVAAFEEQAATISQAATNTGAARNRRRGVRLSLIPRARVMPTSWALPPAGPEHSCAPYGAPAGIVPYPISREKRQQVAYQSPELRGS